MIHDIYDWICNIISTRNLEYRFYGFYIVFHFNFVLGSIQVSHQHIFFAGGLCTADAMEGVRSKLNCWHADTLKGRVGKLKHRAIFS